MICIYEKLYWNILKYQGFQNVTFILAAASALEINDRFSLFSNLKVFQPLKSVNHSSLKSADQGHLRVYILSLQELKDQKNYIFLQGCFVDMNPI